MAGSNNADAAVLCYICASNGEKALGLWEKEMARKKQAQELTSTAALQTLIERIAVFRRTTKDDGSAYGARHFTAYASMLAYAVKCLAP